MTFDKERPFSDKGFLKDVYEGLKIKFKLYGVIPYKKLFEHPEEIDVDMGEIHITEVDLKQLSALMDRINKKYGTNITYCLYHSEDRPGDMLLNIRGPKAPSDISPKIRFYEKEMPRD